MYVGNIIALFIRFQLFVDDEKFWCLKLWINHQIACCHSKSTNHCATADFHLTPRSSSFIEGK